MNYPVHILQIKLWEWEGVKESCEMQMNKSGPFDEAVNGLNQAIRRIQELQKAIDLLNKQQ